MAAQSIDARRRRFLELFQIAMEHFVDQTRFARARNAGDADQQAEGNLDVDIFEIVGAGAADLDRALRDCGLRWRAGNGIVLRWLR